MRESNEEVGPGGLLGVLTELDPFLTKADSLSGSLAGKDLPQVWSKLSLKTSLFQNILGEKIDQIKVNEQIMINIGTARTLGIVKEVKKDVVEVDLRLPVCADKGERAVLSRRVADRWRLVGFGYVV